MSLREFETGPLADPAKARIAALIDFGAGLVAAVIAFPFPFARAALPVPVFVVSILLSIVVVHELYCALALTFLGRTPGMYLLDLGPDPRPRLGAAVAWALGASIAFWPTVFGVRSVFDPATGLSARLSGVQTRSTRG